MSKNDIAYIDTLNHLRWQPIADRNERPKPYTIIRRFLFRYRWIEIIEKQ